LLNSGGPDSSVVCAPATVLLQVSRIHNKKLHRNKKGAILFFALGRIAPAAIRSREISSPVPRSRSAQSNGADAARIALEKIQHAPNLYRTFTGSRIDADLTDEIKTFIVKGLACFAARVWSFGTATLTGR
jgi:hypothetical protein